MAERWGQLVAQALTADASAPHQADQYFALQTVVGSVPWGGPDEDDYRARLRACLGKSVREAGLRTTWGDPDAAYEQRLFAWVDQLLDPVQSSGFAWLLRQLLCDLQPLAQRVSLVQAGLRCCLPGVPDVYQGSELEDLSLVDPDNRRPVDFATRAQLLSAAPAAAPSKLATLCLGLRLRAADPQLWRSGTTTWLLAAEAPPGVFAYSRAHGRSVALVLACIPLVVPSEPVNLDPSLAARRWRDAATGAEVGVRPGQELAELLAGAPFRCLIAD
jgi:(1->4)-alpha-D-glucan 1-alpha-D-glucosylmutase